MKKHYDSLDLLKFFLSLVILAIHTDFLKEGIYPWARLAVPCFLTLTGFFVFGKLDALSDETERRKAVWGVVKRYLLLYAVWMIVHFPIVPWKRFGFGKFSFRHSMFNFVHNFLLNETFRGSWYLMACILGVPIVYFLFRKFSKRTVLTCSVLLYVAVSVYEVYNGILKRWSDTAAVRRVIETVLIDPENSFLIAIPYLTLGKMMAENKKKQLDIKGCLLGLAVCLTILYGEFVLAQEQRMGSYMRTCYLMLAPASFFLVTAVLQMNLHSSRAHFYRMASTIIYFLHIPVMEAVCNACAAYAWHQNDEQRIVLTLTTTLICLLACFLIGWLEKTRFFRFLRYLH